MDSCHLKQSELDTKFQKHEGRVVERGDAVKDDSGSWAIFAEKKVPPHRTWLLDVVSRLPDCAGEASDAVSANTAVKMDGAPKLFTLPEGECPVIWIRIPRSRSHKIMWQNDRACGTIWKDTYRDIHQQDHCGNENSRRRMGENTRMGMLINSSNSDMILSVYVDD